MKRYANVKWVLFAVFVMFVLSLSCGGSGSGGNSGTKAPGTLDESFGTGGMVLVNTNTIDFAYDITTDSTGRILATGYRDSLVPREMVVWCL